MRAWEGAEERDRRARNHPRRPIERRCRGRRSAAFATRRVQLLLDIEVPTGWAPYELLHRSPWIPRRLRRGSPGSTLDLRVDPANPNNVAILGPAGSLSRMDGGDAASLPRVGLGTRRAAAQKPILSLIFWSRFIPLPLRRPQLRERRRKSSSEEGSGGGSHSSASKHETCEGGRALLHSKIAAASGCKQFKTMSESACRTALEGERKAAAKLKKVCE